MDNRDSSNGGTDIVSLFFTAVAGIGAIVATMSSIFWKSGLFTSIFIDQSIIQLASSVSVISFLLILWIFNSSGIVFLFNLNFVNMEKFRVFALFVFLLSCTTFYLVYVISEGEGVGDSFFKIVQFVSYLMIFSSLGTIIGITTHGMSTSLKRKDIERTQESRIMNTILKTSLVAPQIRILGVSPNIRPKQGEEWSFWVETQLKEDNNWIPYTFLFHGEFNNILGMSKNPNSLSTEMDKDLKGNV